jgi:ADP-ribose pyrophosphatase YjhB (NUDIX family)
MKIQQVFRHYALNPPGEGAFRYCPRCASELVLHARGGLARPSCPACGFVHYRNPAPAVSILIADHERLLLGLRKGEPRKGFWALPSGYIEFEDDFIAAAAREAREETGLEIKVTAILNVASSFYSPRFHFLGIYLAGEVTGGQLAAGDDLAEVGWFPLAGLLPVMAFAEDVEAIRLFCRKDFRPLPVENYLSEP